MPSSSRPPSPPPPSLSLSSKHPVAPPLPEPASPMSWSTTPDFQPSPSFPFASYLYNPKSPSASPFSPGSFSMSDRATPDHVHHIYSLEQNFCSNFSCCGLALADMHQLLEHFEEAHVVVIGQDGHPVLQRSSSGNTPSVASRKGVKVISYPQPHPPLPMDTTVPSDPVTSPAMALRSLVNPPNPELNPTDVLADFDPYEMDTAGSSSSSSDSVSSPPSSAFPSPNPHVPICLPPALLTMRPQSAQQDYPMGDVTLDGDDGVSGRKRPVGKTTSFELNGRKTRILEGPPSPASKKPNREKMFKCPHPGCSKSYLNPNGLKYHLEKGTCTVDPAALASAHVRTAAATPFQVSN
ncbi:hypothetical protein BXZ70DRAFT_448434 [Cristinia sonorae]|uniref:C2H2-type domain-containing protein n=1 Tax=Cristinia sonorae TaxID=1940300 RepID=A0A8K0UJ90_9AGAR|nr:hypothetical protein BXZ70DRAFT_448434 [Cristinia sonorae]